MAKSKLNSIENLILQALNDMGISHEEFVTLLKEKGKYDKMKESFKSAVKDEKEKNVRLNNMLNHVQDLYFTHFSTWLILYAPNDFNWLKNIHA